MCEIDSPDVSDETIDGLVELTARDLGRAVRTGVAFWREHGRHPGLEEQMRLLEYPEDEIREWLDSPKRNRCGVCGSEAEPA